MIKLLDKIPLIPLAIVSIFLLFAPFSPEPHLLQKIKMLFAGDLKNLMDVFDLFWHGTPITLLMVLLYRKKMKKSKL